MGGPKSIESGPCPKQTDLGTAQPPPLKNYAFVYKTNDLLYFMHRWAKIPYFGHTPAGKEEINLMVFFIKPMVFYTLSILLSYRERNGNRGFRVTPTNNIETMYGKAW